MIEAAITGDLIDSRKLNPEFKNKILTQIEDDLKKFESFFKTGKIYFDIFRGDSFQILIKAPEKSLEIALLLIAIVRANSTLEDRLGVRIAIGIGESGYLDDNIGKSGGEAFLISGKLIDNLKKENNILKIETNSDKINSELNVEVTLLNPIIKRWSSDSAKVIYYDFLDYKQNDIADKLDITQPTVHSHLSKSNIKEVRVFCDRFKLLISNLK